MIAEMNQLRRNRAANPDLERTLFDSRADWSDLQIQQHMSAVQLANVFEWAYLARREGLIEADVWRSWVETWRAVILGSEPLRNSFTPNVWTFGREHHMAQVLDALITGTGEVPDPLQDKSRFARKIAGI